MKRSSRLAGRRRTYWAAAVVASSLTLGAVASSARAACVGDCDGSGDVTVNELIAMVNIALGNAPLSTCLAGDANGSGDITVNEIVQAVSSALTGCAPPPTPTATPGAAVCGNGVIEGDEECDDGNTLGADGCAANCTRESLATCMFATGTCHTGGACTTLQLPSFAITFPVVGHWTLRVGKARVSEGTGETPFAMKAEDVQINPVAVPGILCVCLRGVATPDGTAGQGRIGCGPNGLAEVDYSYTRDHTINDVDPTCASGTPDPEPDHAGVCISPINVAATGGGPRGSIRGKLDISVSLILDNGTCSTDPSDPAKGPDGLPCTADDPNQAGPTVFELTTGTATSQGFDINAMLGINLPPADEQCGSDPCIHMLTGAPASCDGLIADPARGLSKTKIVSSYVNLHTPLVGDVLPNSTWACQ